MILLLQDPYGLKLTDLVDSEKTSFQISTKPVKLERRILIFGPIFQPQKRGASQIWVQLSRVTARVPRRMRRNITTREMCKKQKTWRAEVHVFVFWNQFKSRNLKIYLSFLVTAWECLALRQEKRQFKSHDHLAGGTTQGTRLVIEGSFLLCIPQNIIFEVKSPWLLQSQMPSSRFTSPSLLFLIRPFRNFLYHWAPGRILVKGIWTMKLRLSTQVCQAEEQGSHSRCCHFTRNVQRNKAIFTAVSHIFHFKCEHCTSALSPLLFSGDSDRSRFHQTGDANRFPSISKEMLWFWAKKFVAKDIWTSNSFKLTYSLPKSKEKSLTRGGQTVWSHWDARSMRTRCLSASRPRCTWDLFELGERLRLWQQRQGQGDS